jgi:phosphoenolpyruvate-protein kinase (PTS system EI component)
MIPLLLGVGVRHLSMAPRQIPKVKKRLRGLYLARCIDLAEQAIEADDAAAVAQLLEEFDS